MIGVFSFFFFFNFFFFSRFFHNDPEDTDLLCILCIRLRLKKAT